MGNFFEKLWNYLYDAYFNIGRGYENLGTESSPLVTAGTIVFGLFIGSVIACIIVFYNRQVVGSAVRRLLSENVFSREAAKTISELGYKKNFFVNSFFRDNQSLKRIVKCVEEEDFYAEQEKARLEYEEARKENKKLPKFKEEIYRVDVTTDRFYIPEDLKYRAEIRYNKKGSTWLSVILGIVLLTVIFFAVLLVLPWILGETNSAFGAISGASGT